MKKTISIFLVVIMIFSCLSVTAGAAEESAKIVLNGTEYSFAKGETIKYSCLLTTTSLISNGQFTLNYPADMLQITGVSFPVVSDAMYNYSQNVENMMIFNFSRPTNLYDFTQGADFVIVNFKVIGTGSGEIKLDKNILSDGTNSDALDNAVFTEALTSSDFVMPKISATKKNLFVKKSFTLKVTGGNANSKVTWKSSKTKVATVNSNGKVVAKKAGKTTITATKDGVTMSCKVVVKNPTVKAQKATIKVKKTTKITVKNAVGKTKFKSKTPKVAKVNSKGTVTGLKKGTAKIQVTASGVNFTVKIKVK